jgi:hypothetical protein
VVSGAGKNSWVRFLGPYAENPAERSEGNESQTSRGRPGYQIFSWMRSSKKARWKWQLLLQSLLRRKYHADG